MKHASKLKGLLGLVALFATAVSAAADAPPKPNIIHILADDLGWGSVGFNGQTQIQTPHLDELAGRGMVFRNAYAATVCAPSRAMLYTGFHQGHARVDSNGKIGSGFRAEEIMTPQVLASAGYNSAIFGKWGFGASGTRTIGGSDPLPTITSPNSLPNNHGFGEFYGYLNHGAAHDYYYDWMWQTDAGAPNGLTATPNNGGPGGQPEYTHDLVAARSEQFIASHAGGVQPFYMQVNYTIPHNDIDAIADAPGGYGPYADLPWTDKEKAYAAMITRMDASIGALLAKLEDPNGDGDTSDSIRSNTLILFTSDNGPTPEDGSPIEFFDANGQYRGGKRDLYEGGIIVPAVAAWQGVIPEGVTSDYRTDLADFMATAANLAGVETPVGIDGVSIVPTLTGQGVQLQRPYLVFEHHENSGPDPDPRATDWTVIRQDGKKLIRFTDGSYDLFDLSVDPGETTPLNRAVAANAQLAAELQSAALAENVQGGFVEYRQWIGPNGGALHDSTNWNGGGQPNGNWTAVVANNGATPAIAVANASTATLGLEVRGATALQTMDVSPGVELSGRNEVRISSGGRITLADAALSSNRWVNIRGGGQLTGSGQVTGNVYNGGTIAPGRPADLPAVQPPSPPPPLPPENLDTGVTPAVTFNFTGIQDDAPLTQTSALSPYATLQHGLDFGPGVSPRGASNDGDEFNVQGHYVGGTLDDAIAAGDYLTFTLAPKPGVGIIADSVSFTIRRNGTNAARNFAILSSVGGFSSTEILAQLQTTDTISHLLTANFSTSAPVFEPIELRLYGWNAQGANGNTHVYSAAMSARFVGGPTLAFDFTGVQDQGPVTQLAVSDPNLVLVEGFNSGAGLAPREPGGGGTNAGDEFNLTGFQIGGNLAGAIAASDYVGFKVQAVPGLALKPQSVTFELWRNGANSPTEYAILSSIDGFTAADAIAQATYNDAGSTNEHALKATFGSVEPTTEPVEFRLYGWNAGNSSGHTHFVGASMRAEYSTVALQTFGPTGVLAIDGDLHHLSGATLAVEIGGAQPGEFDRLDVTGAVDLDGDLEVSLTNLGQGAYTPTLGDQFTLLTAAGGVTGAFANATLPQLGNGMQWRIDYNANDVTLKIIAAADFDADGDVDGDDLGRWRSGFGKQTDVLQADGDADSNGTVDGADFLLWQRQVGLVAPAQAPAAQVPEPAALALSLMLSGIGIAARNPWAGRRPSSV
jgi:arylsulfatase A-like enzyme